jgi:hypothetical protein
MKKIIKKLLAPIIREVMDEAITKAVQTSILVAGKFEISPLEKKFGHDNLT